MKKVLLLLTALCAFGLSVYDIQYSTEGPSPYDGEEVTVTGVVTGAGYDGDKYFIADTEGGPWRGVYVYDYSHSVSPGDYITIDCEVDEYYDLTELKNVSTFSVDGTRPVPDPYTTTIGDIEESLEGVLVEIADVTVDGIDGDYWTISDGTGSIEVRRGFDYTAIHEIGAEIDRVVGLVSYTYGNFILEPRSNEDAGSSDTTTTPTDTNVVAIADIQADPGAYDEVTVEGIITGPAGATRDDMLNAWLQDESGMGIMLFGYDIPTGDDFARGNHLRVTGTVTEYNGVTELTDMSWELLGTGDMPEPLMIDDYWSTATDYEGTWCEVTGELSDVYNTSGDDYNLTVESVGGNSVVARVWGTTGIDAGALSAGDVVTIRGVGSVYSSAFQLLPCMPEDIEFSSDSIPDDTTTTDLTPIADIQDDPTAFDRVTIEGVITIPAGATRTDMLNAWIQDESGKGMQLFDYDMPTEMTHFERGARLRCEGTVDEYNGVTELTSFSYDYLGTDTLPMAANFDDISAMAADYEGTWVMLSGMVTDMWTAGGGDNIQVTSDGGSEALIRVWETTGITTEVLVGDHVTAYGIGSMYNDDFQIVPALDEDIQVYTPDPPAEEPMIEIEKAVLAPSLGERIQINYSVPIGYVATLRVFDRNGRSVATLFNGSASYTMQLNWDGRDETGNMLPEGAYMLHLEGKSAAGSLEPVMETVVIGSVLK